MTGEHILEQHWDIIVVGNGAAGLSAALSAATSSNPPPTVLIIDKAPLNWAGGNGYFTAGAYRTRHNGLQDILPLVSNVTKDQEDKIDLHAYSGEDFYGDLQRVTGGRTSKMLGEYVVRESLDVVRWLKEVGGVDWWLSFRRQAYQVEGRWTGCTFSYDTKATKFLTNDENAVCGVEVEYAGKKHEIKASSLILCAGGFEANPELRKKYLGPGWERAHTRGTPYNTGEMLLAAMALGAKTVGDFSPGGCHSVAWDAASPKDGGDREKTNEFTKSGYPLGLMLSTRGKRFVDEGVDLRNYTYAKFGRAILEQPDGIAFQIWDKDGQEWLRDEEYRDEIVPKIRADCIRELAQKCVGEGLIDQDEFVRTVEEYNAAVAAHGQEHPESKLNPAIRDGLSTQSAKSSLQLPKSNWAIPIIKPPFLAVKVTSGITFTFGGLAINPENAAVLREDGSEIEGLYCAGEMVGGLFYGNYPGGSGLTAGGVFGRRAGHAAAEKIHGGKRLEKL